MAHLNDLAQQIARFEELAKSASMIEALALRRTIKRLRAALTAGQQVEAMRHQHPR